MDQPALFDLTDPGLPVRPLLSFSFSVPVTDAEPEARYVPGPDQPALPGLEEL